MKTTALVSIHDVEPRRLPRVMEIVALLEREGVPPVTLLVVPGLDWRRSDVDVLRALVSSGHELAGHGWVHRAPGARSRYHRLHAAVLSRDEAEHLSRTPEDLVERISRCRAWFERVGLPSPDLYVPPAWAMGALDSEALIALGFRWYETLTGFMSPPSGLGVKLPLVGFEADTLARQVGLELWNAANLTAATWSRRPVRVAIHPDDLRLRLGRSLRALLRRDIDFVRTVAWLEELAEVTDPSAIGAGEGGGPPG